MRKQECAVSSAQERFAYGSEKAESDSWGPERPVESASKTVKKMA